MKLTKPDLIRTTTGRFETLGEFMYNNRHLIELGYSPEDIYNISIFNNRNQMSCKCNKQIDCECVLNQEYENEFNNPTDINLKIVKDMYVNKLQTNVLHENSQELNLTTPISEKLYYLITNQRSELQSPISSPQYVVSKNKKIKK